MRNICFYAVATHLGGAERSVLDLMRGLQARPELSYRPWMLLPKGEGPLVRALEEAGLDYEVLPWPGKFFKLSRSAPLDALKLGMAAGPGMALYLARLTALLRRKRPALVHTNALKCHLLASAVSRAAGVPVLWHLRDLLAEGPVLWSMRGMRGPNVHVVANSRATAEGFARRDRAISVVHNGLDPEVFKPAPNRVFHELLGADPSRPMVGIVGVLAAWKGQREFLHMARRLKDSGSRAVFAIVGGEIYDTGGGDRGFGLKLRREARKLGLADDLLFTGFRENAVEAVNALDVLVHASVRPEPFGRVVVEGMACEVPVVATAAGGVLEIVEHEVNGMLVPPGSVESMARTVGFLLESAADRKRLAAQGRAEFLKRFTLDRHVEGMARVYDRMLEE